ncbi:L-threonylcarbamoyladenylate synthase [Rhodoferax saidenbachensis]|uniref:Threonylcarbamoyl-AMP synthase n=1 Tax=Rhodoferax saidenbachensis TaxID=1484693 RepID=A0ABU1ZNN4_9BURK|nr:L-threonylcarbamoyladenylate synthase [Rhodoferax saidenbachensis]MDR7307149.1 L-threonylcarbamoyladenylate synthase [Rhodoferax saidenbachensis]
MIVSAYLFADGVELAPDSIAAGAEVVRAGGLMGMPTETVYGLGADASNPVAVGKIFAAKGRPADHPLIVHVAAFDGGMGGVAHYCTKVPAFAQQLMSAFWPGPLTLILPRRDGVGEAAAGGQNSIGLRCPAHPVAQALLAALRKPAEGETEVWGIAAPSANKFGRVSPTTAEHVHAEFGDDLLILDGGPCEVGIESTIIDCTRGAPVLLRPGSITAAQVEAACGRQLLSKEELDAQSQPGPRASGTLESHYAPSATVRLMDAKALQAALDLLASAQAPDARPTIALYHRSPLKVRSPLVSTHRMPNHAQPAAHELFAKLREMDAQGVKLIWVETPPESPEWDGVRDRLTRAAAH